LPLLVERYAALADAPGKALARPLPRPHLRADPVNLERVARALGIDLARSAVAFCPGAEYGEAKRWPVEHFAALALRAVGAGQQVWLVGSQNDGPIGRAVAERAAHPCVVDLCGRTKLTDAIDLLSAAAAVVSNDSGLMHVAAALNRPLIALYGSSSAAYTPPLASSASVLALKLDCSPCFQRTCPLGHLRCLRDLAPERVWEALAAQLGRVSSPGRGA
jgi:heptosyltransferase-2